MTIGNDDAATGFGRLGAVAHGGADFELKGLRPGDGFGDIFGGSVPSVGRAGRGSLEP
jgi:hypothetical protein